MTARLYVPLTVPELARAVGSGVVEGLADAFVADDDSEEAEYAALLCAADASGQLVAGLEAGGRRRVVAVVEAEADALQAPWSQVVAVHADTRDDADPDDDLGWFATQEVGDVIAH